jgi:hypothetical protein
MPGKFARNSRSARPTISQTLTTESPMLTITTLRTTLIQPSIGGRSPKGSTLNAVREESFGADHPMSRTWRRFVDARGQHFWLLADDIRVA